MKLKKSVEYYDFIANGYNRLYGDEQINKIRFLFENKILTKEEINGSLMLDVGCGSMVYSNFFKLSNLVGIDPSIALLRQTKNIRFLGYAEKMPFSSQVFDIVISMSAIQNFNDIAAGIREIIRVTKKNGKIIISVSDRFRDVQEIIESELSKITKKNIINQKSNKSSISIFNKYFQEKDIIYVFYKKS